MALQELRHEFICGYKEFFVTWDKEEEAMFVCIVMDYYEMGDLAKVIKTKRAKKEKIEKMVMIIHLLFYEKSFLLAEYLCHLHISLFHKNYFIS